MKKITILGLGHYFGDSRIFYKQALSLSREFNVDCLWGIFSNKKGEFEENGIKNIGFSGNRFLILFKAWFYGIINKSDIYVAHDIDSYLVVVGIKLFKWKSKIIFDSHEYYDLYDKSKFSKFDLTLLIIFSKIIKPFTIGLFSGVTIVTYDMKNFYKSVKKKEVIFNYPIVSIFNTIDSNKNLSKDFTYFVYHGGISKDRGIYEMIYVFELYFKKNKNIRFLLIGNFLANGLEDNVRNKLIEKGLLDYFIITGQLSLFETFGYLKNDVKKVGFCLLDNVGQMSKTIPIKMLEYLYLDIPQIGSNHIRSFNSIISENKAGFAINYGSIEEGVEAIKEIYNNYDEYIRNCRKIKDNYTWENEENKLLEFYKNVINER